MNLWKDLLFAVRTLTSRPLMHSIAIVSMALGIGANTAIVSLIDAVLWRTLPVEDARELILLDYEVQPGVRMGAMNGWSTQNERGATVSTSFKYPSFQRYRERDDLFRTLFAFAPLRRSNLTVQGVSELVEGEIVSGDFFSGLGLSPFLGRLIDDADNQTGAQGVAVLQYDYWQSRFGRASRGKKPAKHGHSERRGFSPER